MRGRARVCALATGCFVAVLSFTVDAAAFCRTTTINAAPTFDPQADGCFDQGGIPLYHPSQCLPYRLLTNESPVISNAVLGDALARAFSAWTAPNAKCTPGITAIELPPIAGELVGYTVNEPGRNVTGVAATWPHGQEVQALTTLTYLMDTGAIRGFAMELRPDAPWSFSEVPAPEAIDLQGVITHEAGHVLGFAHSADPEATMFSSAQLDTTDSRSLGTDDVEAICTVYPTRGARLAKSGIVPSTVCALATGAVNPDGTCAADPQILHGCSAGAGATSSGAGAGAVVALGLCALRRRRSRR